MLHVDERTVADIWERQAFDRSALAALGLAVLFRGLPSDAGGPDYQEVVLARDGRSVITGDVEFHVTVSDWYAHGHHRDPHYESVVLHVAWQGTGETRTLSGRVVPTLVLREAMPSGVPVQLGLARVTHPCVAAYAALPPEELSSRVQAAGLERFHQRAAQFAADLTGVSPDQVIYTAILEALGYASNRSVFRALAEAAPYAWLASLPPEERGVALLTAAGFVTGGAPVPARLPADAWRLTRLRPANHPARRLAGMSALLQRFGHSPSGALEDRLLDRACSPRDAIDFLSVRENGSSPIGAGRATEILASAVLPFLAALHPGDGRPEELYRGLPAPPSNRWTRAMIALIGNAGHTFKVSRAPEHQGLHWLYHTHCRYERRRGCPLCGSSAGRSHPISYRNLRHER